MDPPTTNSTPTPDVEVHSSVRSAATSVNDEATKTVSAVSPGTSVHPAATIEATTANRIAPEGGWVHIVSREGAGVRSAGAFDDHVGGLDGGHSQDAGLQAQLVDSLG